MGIPDSSLADLVQKVRSWLSWGASEITPSLPVRRFEMSKTGVTMCSECDAKCPEFCSRYYCQSCGRRLCPKCVRGCESNLVTRNVGHDDSAESLKSCKFCNGVDAKLHARRKHSRKVFSYDSPRESPEPPSPSFSGESVQSDRLAPYLESRDYGYSPNGLASQHMTSISAHPSPVSAPRSSSRSDEEEAEDSWKHYYSPSSEYCHDISDIDSSSVNARLEFYDCKSLGSSPLDSPSRIDFSSCKVGHSVQPQLEEGSQLSQNASFDQETMTVLRENNKKIVDLENSDDCSNDLSIMHSKYQKPPKPLDFESNGLIWFPPPPEDENDEANASFFAYDDDDDDDNVGISGAIFSSSNDLSNTFPSKEKQNEGSKEPLRAAIHGHFRVLVSQLLHGEGIKLSREDNSEDWLDIITTIAWQAANFVKPDTSRGGSMDPGDYVKVKCIASGIPNDSTLVKGIVCTKNIKHKRMTTQCKNPRLLLLGGALEYQSVVTSFNTLVQQENDHLKMIMSKIEALRPNVLLVEKSASPFAQEYLLSKEISLVLNVKKSLLERIGRCSGALISTSIDHISSRLGHCELFRVERVTEEHETANQLNKKPSKTLMFFEGCPRRLGCTVLLRGASREKLKRVKHVVQYAVFAAYHLSLETSFLADEGASLPKMDVKPSIAVPERAATDNVISVIAPVSYHATVDASAHDDGLGGLKPEPTKLELLCGPADMNGIPPLSSYPRDCRLGSAPSDAYQDELGFNVVLDSLVTSEHKELSQLDLPDNVGQEGRQLEETYESTKSERINEDEINSEHFSAADTYQSILVSFSSRCIVKGTVCERSRPLRIKFYGSFDKPLGRYLRDDLFDQTSYCRSCKEPAEAHVLCYTHQQGNLTINVRSLSSVKLPGEQDGKIWMWHRCLRCAHIDGVPPATRRVLMSDAAWGLSFGKFLELSFTNNATANRVAPCGHSLQRDCLRFYGFGRMVVFFRYSPIDILNVHLPPSVLEFNFCVRQEWISKEAAELLQKMEIFYGELSEVLSDMESKSKSLGSEFSDVTVLQNHIMELKGQLVKEKNDYNAMLQPAVMGSSQLDKLASDILELNRLRRSLLFGSHVWYRKLYSLDSLLNLNYDIKSKQKIASYSDLKETLSKEIKLDRVQEENVSGLLYSQFGEDLQLEQHDISLFCEHLVPEHSNLSSGHHNRAVDMHLDGNINMKKEVIDHIPSDISNLSDRIDCAWTGTDPLPAKLLPLHTLRIDMFEAGSFRQLNVCDSPPVKRMTGPARVQSFDSALRSHERLLEGLPPPSLHLSSIRSFHASGDYRSMLRDPVANAFRTYSQALPFQAQKLNFSSVFSASHMVGGARLLLSQRCHTDIVIGVYDDDPASVVSFALTSKEYDDWVSEKPDENVGSWSTNACSKQDTAASTFSAFQPFSSTDSDYIHYGPEDPSTSGTLYTDSKKSPHLTISFGDDSPIAGGKVRFSVTCYFAKQFDSLRKKCCPGELDFVRSLSRCQRWSAQGGKSNVYFAKSMDERFIIKQVKKTELESFEEFAPEYFKYLTDSLNSGSPSCLAKILGIYQVTVKHWKGGKETKMELMVMENLFFKRHISRVYDLKGSARSRYNADTSGTNKVLLDMNLVESLCTEPIFLGSKAKRSLERAIWNDTSFLASVDVMDYSLLVGLDEERKELVLGIIDFMRQYTWDKHLETWVKASGILGGPKNAAPTIISPKQYKKRFRKAMTSYFLTVPDQWSS